jgi:hypothetical protein
MTPAVAARVRQLAGQAEHRRAIAEFRARHAANQHARINALLPKPSPPSPASSASQDPTPAKTPATPAAHLRHRQDLPEREQRMLPNHEQTAWPLTDVLVVGDRQVR